MIRPVNSDRGSGSLQLRNDRPSNQKLIEKMAPLSYPIGGLPAFLALGVTFQFFRLNFWKPLLNFKNKHPMIFGGLFAISALQIFYQIGEDVFLPLYANLLKPKIASLLNFFGVPYPSFAGDNSVSQYTLLQRQQDFIRESTDREQEMLRKLQESQKAQQEMKDQLNGLRKEVDTLQGIPVDLPSK